MDWAILSLAKWQKTLEWRDSLLGEHVLEKTAKGVVVLPSGDIGRSEVTCESTLGDLSRRNAWPCRSQAVGRALAGLQSRWHSRAFLPEALGEDLFLCLFCRAEAVCIPLLTALPLSAQPATLHLSDPFSRCDCVGATWTSQGSLPIARSAHQQPDFSLPCNVTFTGSGDSGVAIFGGPSCCLS